jgi:hypothetical protein
MNPPNPLLKESLKLPPMNPPNRLLKEPLKLLPMNPPNRLLKEPLKLLPMNHLKTLSLTNFLERKTLLTMGNHLKVALYSAPRLLICS